MSEKSNPVSQKARDEAIRALASHGGLTPDQISELKLSQVHLTTGTLAVHSKESAKESAPADQPATLKLDSNTHRAIIAWLVVRPDSSNDHLFPGAGLAGLDVTIIREVVAAAAAAKPSAPVSPPPGAQAGKPAEGKPAAGMKPSPSAPASPGAQGRKPAEGVKPPASISTKSGPTAPGTQARKPGEAPKTPPPAAPGRKPVGLPEAIVKKPASRPGEQPAPSPAADHKKGEAPKPQSPPPPPPAPVPLDEIEALRNRLAEVYDDWSPVVARAEAPSAPSIEEELEEPVAEEEPAVDLEEIVETPVTPEPVEAEVSPALEAEVEAPSVVAEPPSRREEREEIDRTIVAKPSSRRKEKEKEEEGDQTMVAKPGPAPAAEKPAGAPAPAARPMTPAGEWLKKASQDRITLNLSYRAMALVGVALVVVCCLGLVAVSGLLFGLGGAEDLLAEATPTPTETELPTEPPPSPTPSPTAKPTLAPSPTATTVPTPTPVPPTPTVGPTSTPVVIVVTATPSPTSPPTATPVRTATHPASAQPTPTAAPAAAFKYPAPVITWPENNGLIPTKIALLKWKSATPLAPDEWYAVRLIFQRQGKTVYEGDSMQSPEWWLPERLYYMADGPTLEYHWFVFVERHNPDGSTTPLSPQSDTYTFRWQ